MIIKRFTNIYLFSHPRSGSYYMRQLLIKNFVFSNGRKWVKNNSSHWIGKILESKIPVFKNRNRDVAYIYIYRQAQDVLKSVYSIRSLFGLDVDNYQDFLDTKYSDMFNGNISPGKVFLNSKEFELIYCNKFFENCNYKPFEFWMEHLGYWYRVPDVYMICYDDLIENFYNTMLNLSIFLGVDFDNKLQFENIEEKVGYWQ
ncbi:MAG: hypothetical protein GF317_04755 [Candidatus Lokiarchaeota archaeon]|nr:hypothetical protein [Candidatus Lokiarchaeota archaeon]